MSRDERAPVEPAHRAGAGQTTSTTAAWRPVFGWPVAIGLTLPLASIEVVMLADHGPLHVLWLSHIAVLGSLAAIWARSRRIASMVAVGTLLPESIWVLDFLPSLLVGDSLTGATAYMFSDATSLQLRLLSAVLHLSLPPLMFALLWRLGYDRYALLWQTLLLWLVLPLGWLLGPERNINWTWSVFGLTGELMPSWLHLICLMLLYPLLIHLPMHVLLRRWQHARAPDGVASSSHGG